MGGRLCRERGAREMQSRMARGRKRHEGSRSSQTHLALDKQLLLGFLLQISIEPCNFRGPLAQILEIFLEAPIFLWK